MLGWRAIVAIALLTLITGLWLGDEWRQGRVAIANAKVLKQAHDDDQKLIKDYKDAADALKQIAVDRTIDYHQAEQRIAGIADQLEKDHEQNREFATQQRVALAAIVDAHPGLRDQRLGDDVLRHWRQSNAGRAGHGESAAPATAAPGASQPAHAVPGAPAAGKRPDANSVGKPRRSGGAISRLQGRQGLAAPRNGRMEHHGVGVVLQGRGLSRDFRDRVQVTSAGRLNPGDAGETA